MNYLDLPDDTRIWIYQANRQLTDKEISEINRSGRQFIDSWTAHGAKMQAAIEIFYNQFVIIFADENAAKASGCSIDKSVHFIKSIERDLNLSLLNRNLIAYKKEETIVTCDRNEFTRLAEQGDVSEETVVFNNLVKTKAELLTAWQVPLKKSWHRDLVT